MPPTLAEVAAVPGLGLRPLTGPLPDAAVAWVAVSELEDPTPFLEGGELVLTTGMRLTPSGAAGYVGRLVARGAAGLGFGVGVLHGEVPPELVAAARDQGLPLLEVPRPTPFIAVGKAVSRMLARERYEDVTRAFQAQRELTRAALDGPGPLVARLARLLGGWALLLDPSGGVREAEPAAARSRAAVLIPDLSRLAPAHHASGTEPERGADVAPPPDSGSGAGSPSSRGRAGGGVASVALSRRGEHVVLHRVGLGGAPRGFLAVGTSEPLPHVAHTIVGAAVALLTLQSETPRTARELRGALAALLLGRPPGSALPGGPFRVLACAAGGEVVLDALESDAAGERCLALPLESRTAVLVPDELTETVLRLLAPHGPIGVSDSLDEAGMRGSGGGPRSPAGGRGAEDALREAEEALAAVARQPGRRVLRHSDLPGQGVLGLLDPALARAFAEALLAPLDAALAASVRAYVAANGQGEAAARALGVHRHTLRARLRKAAGLLGRDLDDPAARAELWIAFAALDRYAR
ncbi:PucR family transcriptional regulator [Spirillospora albida]|uniref:PucR family transcriptional regulator n=1 Tax=Spirillospora albida TaxID=58123 RepID=UPI0004BF1740|nr:PucR family transcriptional regulator [Spirillospora albida]